MQIATRACTKRLERSSFHENSVEAAQMIGPDCTVIQLGEVRSVTGASTRRNAPAVFECVKFFFSFVSTVCTGPFVAAQRLCLCLCLCLRLGLASESICSYACRTSSGGRDPADGKYTRFLLFLHGSRTIRGFGHQRVVQSRMPYAHAGGRTADVDAAALVSFFSCSFRGRPNRERMLR